MFLKTNTFDKNLKAIQQAFEERNPNKQLEVPDDFFNTLLHDSLERGFLANYEDSTQGVSLPESRNIFNVTWMQIERLPIHPSQEENYDLLSKWQSTLSMAHMLHQRVLFLLQRHDGTTKLYVGVHSEKAMGSKRAILQFEKAARLHMQGISTRIVDDSREITKIESRNDSLSNIGVVTGIPSLRKRDQKNVIQTLDKIAVGIDDNGSRKKNYSLVIIADPVSDIEISNLMGTLLNLQSEIHSCVNTTMTEGVSTNNSQTSGWTGTIGLGKILTGLVIGGACVASGGAAAIPIAIGAAKLSSSIADILGASISKYNSKTRSYGTSRNASRQYLDATARYCESLIQNHIQRLEKGRNLGFWNTGVYVLGDSPDTVETILGLLRSVYAGDETYTEPIRMFNFGTNHDVAAYVQNNDLLPLPVDTHVQEVVREYLKVNGGKGWHILGPLYENFSTALNTEELSISMSLPRRDVPGLKFVRNAVKFAANAPQIESGTRCIDLGEVIDSGVTTPVRYILPVDELNRHALLCGMTGSGKSTTTRRLLMQLQRHDIPFLVIEPTKQDYLQWAVEYNNTVPEENQIQIFMPGGNPVCAANINPFHLNPFIPSAVDGGMVNMQAHIDSLVSILASSMPMSDVLPLLLEESMYELVTHICGSHVWQNEISIESFADFPKLSMLKKVSDVLIHERGYDKEVASNLRAAMRTRINSLTRGWKDDMFNGRLMANEIFNRPAIINLDGISRNADKSLVMALLMQQMREYRASIYSSNTAYRDSLKNGDCLKHFTILEEAHRILGDDSSEIMSESSTHKTALEMFADLITEVRAYGEGLMIVDQSPSKLMRDVIKNTNIKIVHRISPKDDREAVGSCMGLRTDQEEMIATLEKGNVIISSERDDAAMWVHVTK